MSKLNEAFQADGTGACNRCVAIDVIAALKREGKPGWQRKFLSSETVHGFQFELKML